MQRVGVLGISGFIGRNFEKLVVSSPWRHEYEFFGLGRKMCGALNSGVFRYQTVEDCTPHAVREFVRMARPHYVLNCIGKFRDSSFDALYGPNVESTRSLCDSLIAEQCPIRKIVVLGSAAEYGRPCSGTLKETDQLAPLTPYGLTKQIQTVLAQYYYRSANLPTIVARVFNILGEGQSEHLAIGNFERKIHACAHNGTVHVGYVDMLRDYLSIEDVVGYLWRLLLCGEPGEIYNVCSGLPVSMRKVLTNLVHESGKNITIVSEPAAEPATHIASVVGDPGKLLGLGR